MCLKACEIVHVIDYSTFTRFADHSFELSLPPQKDHHLQKAGEKSEIFFGVQLVGVAEIYSQFTQIFAVFSLFHDRCANGQLDIQTLQ